MGLVFLKKMLCGLCVLCGGYFFFHLRGHRDFDNFLSKNKNGGGKAFTLIDKNPADELIRGRSIGIFPIS